MTATVNATVGGTQLNDVRPRAFTTTALLREVAQDQHHVYESITGVPVPNGTGSLVATPHKHDGTNGNQLAYPVIPMQWIDASLPPREANESHSPGPAWSPVVWFPFYAPGGVETISLFVLVTSDIRGNLRVTTQTSSFATTDVGRDAIFHGDESQFSAPAAGVRCIEYRVAVSPGDVNVLKLEAWDGATLDVPAGTLAGTPIPLGRKVFGLCAYPSPRPWRTMPPHESPRLSDSLLTVPADIASCDDSLFVDDLAVSSFLLQRLNSNNAVLGELLNGQPAGGLAAATFTGHNHVDDGSTSLDDSGDEIDHVLGVWSFGVMRGYLTSGHRTDDEAGGNPSSTRPWEGRIFAPANVAATKAGGDRICRVYARIPRHLAASIGSAGNVKCAVMCYKSDTVSTVFDINVSNTTGANTKTTSTASSTTTGRQVIQVANVDCDTDGVGSSVHTEDVLEVELEVKHATAYGTGVYGFCMWIDN